MLSRSCYDFHHSWWELVEEKAWTGRRQDEALIVTGRLAGVLVLTVQLAEVAEVLVWVGMWQVDQEGLESVVQASKPLDGLQALRDPRLGPLDVIACLSLLAYQIWVFLLELVEIWSLVVHLDQYV